MPKDFANITTVILALLVLFSLYLNWDIKKTIDSQHERIHQLEQEVKNEMISDKQKEVIDSFNNQ